MPPSPMRRVILYFSSIISPIIVLRVPQRARAS
jgi:hypothetical protein